MRKYYLCFILILFAANLSATTYKEITDNSEKSTGFFTSYWQEKSGKLYLEIEVWNEEFLMVSYLSRGMGSNDVGLDRGKIGDCGLNHWN